MEAVRKLPTIYPTERPKGERGSVRFVEVHIDGDLPMLPVRTIYEQTLPGDATAPHNPLMADLFVDEASFQRIEAALHRERRPTAALRDLFARK